MIGSPRANAVRWGGRLRARAGRRVGEAGPGADVAAHEGRGARTRAALRQVAGRYCASGVFFSGSRQETMTGPAMFAPVRRLGNWQPPSPQAHPPGRAREARTTTARPAARRLRRWGSSCLDGSFGLVSRARGASRVRVSGCILSAGEVLDRGTIDDSQPGAAGSTRAPGRSVPWAPAGRPPRTSARLTGMPRSRGVVRGRAARHAQDGQELLHVHRSRTQPVHRRPGAQRASRRAPCAGEPARTRASRNHGHRGDLVTASRVGWTSS